MLWKLFILISFCSLTAYFVHIILMFDVNKRVYNHRPGKCRQLKTIIHGSEDITLVEPDGLAFISSGWLNLQMTRPGVNGNIFLFDFNYPDEDPQQLEIEGMENRTTFHPHGITHWVTGDRIRLYAINHNRPPHFAHTIEVFDFDRKKRVLRHVRTIKDQKFIRPNNLVAVAEDVLIIGNDAKAQTGLGTLFEFVTFQKTGSIVLHDGKESYFIAEGVMSPNGIAVDREGKRLIVAHMHDKTMGVYEIADDFTSIRAVSRLDTGTNLDNIWIDKDDSVIIGAHPILKDGLAHFDNCENLEVYAPSQILRMKYSNDWKSAEFTEIFTDEGKFLSGSSGAVIKDRKILIGSVCRQAVLCDISQPI